MINIKNGLLLFFITMSISFAIAYLATSFKLKNISLAMVQLYLANGVLEELIAKNKISSGNIDEDNHTENFIKFLSDSREWAFDYIETSQKTIQEVATELKTKGFNEYSDKLYMLLPDKKDIKE